jgi:hypothetical protein
MMQMDARIAELVARLQLQAPLDISSPSIHDVFKETIADEARNGARNNSQQ